MTQLSKALVQIGNRQDLSGYAEFVGAKYFKLTANKNQPQILDAFRVHKYQTTYDQVLYVGRKAFLFPVDVFAAHQSGKVGRLKSDIFLVDSQCPRIFQPPEGGFTLEQASQAIESRITESYAIGLKSPGGVGTELKQILSDAGAPPCFRCAKTAAKMDLYGIQWCADNMESLIDEIAGNAKASEYLMIRAAARAGDIVGALRPAIRSQLQEAIDRARLDHPPP